MAGRMVRLGDEALSMVGVSAGEGPSGMQTATGTESTDSSGASMVFGMRGDDAWTRIAMEEEAGRIALGHTDGAITLLEY